MDQIIAQGPELVYRGNNENENAYLSSMKVLTTAPTDLWEADMTKETASSLLHQGSLQDFNMVQ